ncbi:hypothetical protein PILCRDRAFT_810853 [Piloderma croceum F 1598]|uniref:Uncharacterized protein n=1 Tax=Piloderma croceum (strain F 1598) TaxID=765440 RepID=A0A0C3GIV4_PILCF|nr:hypothetical protein PILCRDRAFT_810853 [Piloderma croceum F 1598]
MDQNTSGTVEINRHVDPPIATPPQKAFKFRRVLEGDRNPSSLSPLKARAHPLT